MFYCIIQLGSWNSKSTNNLLVLYLLSLSVGVWWVFFVLLVCCFCCFVVVFYQSCNGQKQSSLTEVRRAQIVSLHGERYTERDTADNLRCSNTAVLNAVVKFNADAAFHVRKRSGRPRKTTLREDHSGKTTQGRPRSGKTTQGRPLNEKESNALAKVLVPENPCYCTFKIHSDEFQHCCETSRQRICTEVPHVDTKATLDTNVDENRLNFARHHRHWTLAEVVF